MILIYVEDSSKKTYFIGRIEIILTTHNSKTQYQNVNDLSIS